MLVNVKPDIETIGCRLSPIQFRSSVNSSERVGAVNCTDNHSKCGLSNKAGLTDQEEVGFYSNSNTIDTHDSLPLERAELESLCRELKDGKDIYESIC